MTRTFGGTVLLLLMSALAGPGSRAKAAFPGTSLADLRAGALTDLPLVDLTAGGRMADRCVIFFSGDGGWADIDKTITGDLLRAGLPVVGVDTMRWFLLGRSAGRSSRDLHRILMVYHQLLPAARFVLAGYSRGAETLPFMVRRLPAEARARIRLLVLLAPSRVTDFQMLPIHALRGGTPDWALRAVTPEVRALGGMRMVGFYGTDEAGDSVFTEDPGDFHTVYALPGGHHFGGDPQHHESYLKIAAAMESETASAFSAP